MRNRERAGMSIGKRRKERVLKSLIGSSWRERGRRKRYRCRVGE